MSNINLNNYEAWFLDYFEGNLDATQIAELNSFLDTNPTLKAEFEGDFDNVTLKADNLNFSFKEDLKKPLLVNHENVDDFMIAENEGLLDDKGKLELGAFVAANNLEQDRKLYSLVYLAKTNAIKFPNTSKLKKTSIVNYDNIDDLLIAENEGLLSEKEKEELGAFVTANNLERDRKLFGMVYLAKTNAIRFPNKEKLKKGGAILPLFIRYAAAAAIALLIAFALFYNLGKQSTEPKFAEENPKTNQKNELIVPKVEEDNFNEKNLATEDLKTNESPTNESLEIGNLQEPVFAARIKNNKKKGIKEKHGPDRKKKYEPKKLDNHLRSLAISPVETPKAMSPIEFNMPMGLNENNEDVIAKSNNRTFTLLEYAGVKIKERVLGQNDVEDGKIRENDFAQALASSVNKVSNKDIFTFEDRSNSNAIDYELKLGKVGINRSRAK
ncbi:MAG: hypothetical protein JXQ87_02170 [Bacteroidia bacterium]